MTAIFMTSAGNSQSLEGTTFDNANHELILNTGWEAGLERERLVSAPVPGLFGNPRETTLGTLWYRRRLHLPPGNWTEATLRLGGARFAPAVYINGKLLAAQEGGMAPTEFVLQDPAVAPGKSVLLEVALTSLGDLNPLDASAVPMADRWRSNISSGLWDQVSLHFSRKARIVRFVPWTEFAADKVTVYWDIEHPNETNCRAQAQIIDPHGRVVAQSTFVAFAGRTGSTEIALNHACLPWSPEAPNVYKLQLVVSENGTELDRRECSWGLRNFQPQGLRFELNGHPVSLRGATVVWHRWLRDPEARHLAWDIHWFQRNITQRLKALGANFLRLHLCLPPESLLDLCDREGLMVQLEWPFFHGVRASRASMSAQWRSWLDVAARHPSVVLIHPWNETEGDELEAAWSALRAILPEYPPLVIAHRDEIPVHKYWWSLFENLGLYYDSPAQFGRPIVVDEFGGNYLDSQGEPGAYPATRESFQRFLGRETTRARRLAFQAEASAKVAEYWRRLGAAGVAPFCTLSSPEDGNTWFLGSLSQPEPKPVWAALSAAYAPISVSLEIWNRNFVPGEMIEVPVYFFNDTGEACDIRAALRIVSKDGSARVLMSQELNQRVPAYERSIVSAKVAVPHEVGEWRLEAEVLGSETKRVDPVVSTWDIRTLKVQVPAVLHGARIGVPPDESELRSMLAQNGIRVTSLDDRAACALVLSAASWPRLTQSPAMQRHLADAVALGQSVVLLDIGPRNLGAGYKPFDPADLEGAPRIETPHVETVPLFLGITLTFREVAEPESHLHPATGADSLWSQLPREATWLWNGLRGGLIVPACDMEVAGLRAGALASLWVARGASEGDLINGGGYFGYKLADYYAFSTRADDEAVIARLRADVRQRIDDAPALQDRVNPNAPVEVVDLAGLYRSSQTSGQATTLVPLASAGKNLSRAPIMKLGFGPHAGSVVLSQVLTAGRLKRHTSAPGLYGLRHDPVAEQFVLNLIAQGISDPASDVGSPADKPGTHTR